MKIKLLIDARWIKPNGSDGITRFSREIIKRVNSNDYDVSLLITSKSQLNGLPNFEHIIVNPPKSLKEISLAKRLNKFGFDVVFTPHYIFGGLGRKFLLIRTVHDLIPFRQKNNKAKKMWKLFYSTKQPFKKILFDSEGIITVSNAVKNELTKITSKPIEVVYNAPFNIKGRNVPKDNNLLYIGRYEEYKNVEILIDAINELKKYKLVLAGDCSDSRKKDLLSRSKNKNQINFVGVISDENYKKYLLDSFAVVNGSLDEGFGLPIIEAMSVGCPVICSDTEIFREVAGKAGLFFDPNDSNELVKLVIKLENKKLRSEISKSSIINSSRFDWDKSAEKLQSFLRGLYDKKNR